MPLKQIDNEPWYVEGLNFQCTQCGQCCTGAPGYIWVTDQEIIQIAEHLEISVDEFKKNYLRNISGRWSLNELYNFDCIFLKEKKCQIYQMRPKQCRTFPWWPENLKSKQHWEKAAKKCEGINSAAPKISYQTICEQLAIHDNPNS